MKWISEPLREYLEWEERKENHTVAVTISAVLLGIFLPQAVSDLVKLWELITAVVIACVVDLSLNCLFAININYILQILITPTISILLGSVLLYGHGRWDDQLHQMLLQHRDNNQKIAILKLKEDPEPVDQGENGNASWTETSIEKWKKLMKTEVDEHDISPDIEFTTVESIFHSYTAILNPYGGAYPEFDLENHRALDQILDYIAQGGVFINVADVPCYWAYSEEHGRKISLTEKEYIPVPQVDDDGNLINLELTEIEPFSTNPLLTQLDMRAINIDEKVNIDGDEFNVVRIVTDEPNINGITSVDASEDSHVFANMLYGDGNFIFSLFSLKQDDHPASANVDKLHEFIVKESFAVIEEQTK